MSTSTAQAPVAAGEPKAPAKKQERTKHRRGGRTDDTGARYFLVKTSGTEKMELGEEASSESEAMVTAFRTGGSFAVVTEWKTNADLSNSLPVIKKEAVRKERK
jgi:hypothetical protein